jgi:hypothetical protein
MSHTSPRPQTSPLVRRQPAPTSSREGDRHRKGRVALIETTLLVLAGVLLALATVDDLVLKTNVNHRLVADLRTWRTYTGLDYRNLSIDEELFGENSSREVICGNTSPGPPGARTQLCLAIWGPIVRGRREVRGGWYLAPHIPDTAKNRYACFGAAARGVCPVPAAGSTRSGA